MVSSHKQLPNGVMLNAYPDSIGTHLTELVSLLSRPEFEKTFSLLYLLPTFFNSDLDRGFSIIDYNINEDLVSREDLVALKKLNIMLKFDIVLNHLSVGSPQFQDLLAHGDDSKYLDFFIDWNSFWKGHTQGTKDGIAIPLKEHLDKLFMRKPGLPVLAISFPDGSKRPYWNTFYQQIRYQPITRKQLSSISGLSSDEIESLLESINQAIEASLSVSTIDFGESQRYKKEILDIIDQGRSYLGQMDVNAKSELVWDFYEETLRKVSEYGGKILRLDAFAYLHKEVGKSNFFNTPGTWEHLDRINKIAQKNDLIVLPEIHSEYGLGLHHQVASQGYQIYDFFFPGLVIHTLEKSSHRALKRWAQEIVLKGYRTVNMLGCHDGIPVLDLKGIHSNGNYHPGLLEDKEIEEIIEIILARGGRVKNIYDPAGNKISYYQVNATFFSALGENEKKLLLARAIQLFMPGIPQVWYLDLFAGTNDYKAADAAGSGGHKEINRTTLTKAAIERGLKKNVVLKQLDMIRFRNTAKAFNGTIDFHETADNCLEISWTNKNERALLKANLQLHSFTISHRVDEKEELQIIN